MGFVLGRGEQKPPPFPFLQMKRERHFLKEGNQMRLRHASSSGSLSHSPADLRCVARLDHTGNPFKV